jgi:hypothetical protein
MVAGKQLPASGSGNAAKSIKLAGAISAIRRLKSSRTFACRTLFALSRMQICCL